MSTRHYQGIVLCAALLSIGTPAEPAPVGGEIVSDLAFITPNLRVDVGGGRKMNIYCIGHGSRAVIFEAGLGDQIRAWASVQPDVSKTVMACSYPAERKKSGARVGPVIRGPLDQPFAASILTRQLEQLCILINVPPKHC